jgi:hypothetical protein
MKTVFVISDQDDVVWGVAPSKLAAKIQIQWHLPKHNNYSVEVFWFKN